ncbi:hypothetical protein V6N12_046353 [Hibiscus sabdariffa]|uniref:Uncharacterized protein n=1 Tax=Hibiscus sabdariffa TaxID=183260 RepID=A0ABR2DIE5_9ROSI
MYFSLINSRNIRVSKAHGGRPSENVFSLTDSVVSLKEFPSLECHGQPLPTEVLPAAKKGRIATEFINNGMEEGEQVIETSDMAMEDVDMPGDSRRWEVKHQVTDMGPDLNKKNQGDGQPKLSF